MANYTTHFVSGSIYWAKVHKPVDNYEGTAKEWTLDFVPDDVTFLKEERLLDRLKQARDPIPEDYLRLRKPELDKDGNKNGPIRIYASDDTPWEEGKAIGNGSKVDIKLTVADFGKGKKKAIWTKAIRVQELVPYVSNEFGGMDSSAGKTEAPKRDTKKAAPAKSPTMDDFDDLDDELPPFA